MPLYKPDNWKIRALLSLAVGWLFNCWPTVFEMTFSLTPQMVSWTLFKNSLHLGFYLYTRLPGYILVLSLPLYLLPKYILGQGSFHLIIRSISSFHVSEFEPFNNLLMNRSFIYPNLGDTTSWPWGLFWEIGVLLWHQPGEWPQVSHSLLCASVSSSIKCKYNFLYRPF